MRSATYIVSRHAGYGLALAGLLAAGGCAQLVSSAASGLADNLGQAVLNQNDPETVRAGAPAYLLLLDSFLEGSPDDPELLGAAAELYAAYGAIFAESPLRARRLTARGRVYGRRALCIEFEPACDWAGKDYESFTADVAEIGPGERDALYSYALSSLAYLRAHSDDWNALAELPQMEAVLERLLELDQGGQTATIYMYLGVLNTLRPPALGGRPERAKRYFERAIELTDGRDLAVKVEYARGYARLLYERELHDRLLTEVLAAEPVEPGLTLTNVLAQEDARELMASADDYF